MQVETTLLIFVLVDRGGLLYLDFVYYSCQKQACCLFLTWRS